MKKIMALFLTVLLAAGLLAGCGRQEEEETGLKIVATVFPEYDWVRAVLGDRLEDVDLRLLLKNGVDLHSYQPTAEDLIDIADADLFIYIGGQSDEWIADALKSPGNPDRQVLNLFEVLKDDVKPMVLAEGMEHHHSHHHHGEVADEHVWLSLKRADKAVAAIGEKLEQLDPDHADTYAANCGAYREKLRALDGEYAAAAADARLDTVVFADRFPFFYLMDDYGIHYYAAFPGCSAESEASFETVAFLAGKLDELGAKSLLTIEHCTHKVPQTVIENTKAGDQTVLELNSLQSVTAREVEDGLTYLSVMEDNLAVLKQALR